MMCATCILLLQRLDLAVAVPQLHLLFDGHVSQLLQLGPDVRGDVGLAAALILGCFNTLYLKPNLYFLVASICLDDIVPRHPFTRSLSPRPLQTEQQRQKKRSAPHPEKSPVQTARCSLTCLAQLPSLYTRETGQLLCEN